MFIFILFFFFYYYYYYYYINYYIIYLNIYNLIYIYEIRKKFYRKKITFDLYYL